MFVNVQVTVMELAEEEDDEAKASTDKTLLNELDKNILGRDAEMASAIKAATQVAGNIKKNLGVSLKSVSVRCKCLVVLDYCRKPRNCSFNILTRKHGHLHEL